MNMNSDDLFIDGERLVGRAAREKNLAAILSVANAVSSSYGPHGLDKMLISAANDVSITNDGATILSSMDVCDSASRILVDLARQQDAEAGDGTTSVVILASALIENGVRLIEEGVHPTVVVNGYKVAFKQCMRFAKERLVQKIDPSAVSLLGSVAETTLSSKVLRTSSKLFSKIAVDAVKAIEHLDGNKHPRYDIKEVNILKKQGRSMDESIFVSGYALNCVLASKMMPLKVAKAKIACLDMDLQGTKMGLSVSISVDNPERLEEIRKKETQEARDRIAKLLKEGASVILTTKGISEACIKLIVEAGAMGIKRCKREDLLSIAKATGTHLYSSFEEVDGTEFAPTFGLADSVSVHSFGEDECVLIKGTRQQHGASIVLRGPNEQVLDEMERSIHDCLCALKRTLECPSVVVGGGAFETALSLYISELSLSLGTSEQIVLQRFADALLKIPKTLLVNAALDSHGLLARLLAAQSSAGQSLKPSGQLEMGLDLSRGEIRNNFKAGVIEPSDIKFRCLSAATEAAISILRIDEIILLNAEKDPRQNA